MWVCVCLCICGPVCVCVFACVFVILCICASVCPFSSGSACRNAAQPLQRGNISGDHRRSFPSPLPSGVALNIKLFNLIQFTATNTRDWTQMSRAAGPPPGPASCQGLGGFCSSRIQLKLGLALALVLALSRARSI